MTLGRRTDVRPGPAAASDCNRRRARLALSLPSLPSTTTSLHCLSAPARPQAPTGLLRQSNLPLRQPRRPPASPRTPPAMPYTGKTLPAITSDVFLAILLVPPIVLFGIAYLIGYEGRPKRRQKLAPAKERVLILGASGASLACLARPQLQLAWCERPLDPWGQLSSSTGCSARETDARASYQPRRRHREGAGAAVRPARRVRVRLDPTSTSALIARLRSRQPDAAHLLPRRTLLAASSPAQSQSSRSSPPSAARSSSLRPPGRRRSTAGGRLSSAQRSTSPPKCSRSRPTSRTLRRCWACARPLRTVRRLDSASPARLREWKLILLRACLVACSLGRARHDPHYRRHPFDQDVRRAVRLVEVGPHPRDCCRGSQPARSRDVWRDGQGGRPGRACACQVRPLPALPRADHERRP